MSNENKRQDRPWRGAEFDPDDQGAGHPTTDAPAATPVPDDEVDGQIEGLLAASMGNESVMMDVDSMADEYLAHDEQEARERVLAQEHDRLDGTAASDLAAAVSRAGD